MDGPMEEMFWLILAGEEMKLFGKPVRFTIEWPEGLPSGFTEEQIRGMAIKRAARARTFAGGWVGQAND